MENSHSDVYGSHTSRVRAETSDHSSNDAADAEESEQLIVMFINMGECARELHDVNEDKQKPKLLHNIWGSDSPHIVITAEASELPRDRKYTKLMYGLEGQHTSEPFDNLAVHARVGINGGVRLLWQSSNTKINPGHAAIFEVDFGDAFEQHQSSHQKNCSMCSRSGKLDEELAYKIWRAGLNIVRCCVMHFDSQTEGTATCPTDAWIWGVLQQVVQFRVDILAASGKQWCDTHCQPQEEGDKYKTFPTVLRKMVITVNELLPYWHRLHVSPLVSGNAVECSQMFILSWGRSRAQYAWRRILQDDKADEDPMAPPFWEAPADYWIEQSSSIHTQVKDDLWLTNTDAHMHQIILATMRENSILSDSFISACDEQLA